MTIRDNTLNSHMFVIGGGGSIVHNTIAIPVVSDRAASSRPAATAAERKPDAGTHRADEKKLRRQRAEVRRKIHEAGLGILLYALSELVAPLFTVDGQRGGRRPRRDRPAPAL
jgi:hypothetical protein